MEERKQEQMMAKVQQKLQADREFESSRQSALEQLQKKMAEQKKEQDEKAEETRRFLKDLEKNMKAKPLLLEQVYRFGRVVMRLVSADGLRLSWRSLAVTCR
eukprot:gb/GFBE01024669.1/.p1 GENE.gb/GFBE01024669.1/~~gb/GFBE01024669.1/.p1  ORF type:complete len:102 (+),score=40.95 gb/GFBE01024669.1/:1-306(+)